MNLPCPFCGSEVKIEHNHGQWVYGCSGTIRCWIMPRTTRCLSEDEAKEIWNNRIENRNRELATVIALQTAADICFAQCAALKLVQGGGMDQAIGAKTCELEIQKRITKLQTIK